MPESLPSTLHACHTRAIGRQFFPFATTLRHQHVYHDVRISRRLLAMLIRFAMSHARSYSLLPSCLRQCFQLIPRHHARTPSPSVDYYKHYELHIITAFSATSLIIGRLNNIFTVFYRRYQSITCQVSRLSRLFYFKLFSCADRVLRAISKYCAARTAAAQRWRRHERRRKQRRVVLEPPSAAPVVSLIITRVYYCRARIIELSLKASQ